MLRILVCCLLTFVAPVCLAQEALKVGDQAPEFVLLNTVGKEVRLSDYRGKKPVVLAFIVMAFTGGDTKELQAYQARVKDFESDNIQVIAISMDSFAANKRFAEDIRIDMPLLSDWKRKTSQDYGLFIAESGYGRRATFLVDKNGIIQYVQSGRPAFDPGPVFEAVKSLR